MSELPVKEGRNAMQDAFVVFKENVGLLETAFNCTQLTIEALDQTIKSQQSQIERYEKAIRNAMNELGIPQPGYPSPVANAYDILAEALTK